MKSGWGKTVVVAAVTVATLGAATVPAYADSIEVLSCPPGGRGGQVDAVNVWGTMAGRCVGADDRYHAVRWASDGSVTEFGFLPGGTSSSAAGINAGEQIVGSSTVNSHTRAVRWDSSGTITDLGTVPGHTDSAARAINGYGTIAGSSDLTQGFPQAVRWDADGTITALASVGQNHTSVANAVSDSGVIVGTSLGPDSHHYAVRWDTSGAATVLPTLPGGTRCQANAITAGESTIAGTCDTPDGIFHAVRWYSGAVIRLPELPGHRNTAVTAVNANGVYVGSSQAPNGDYHAVRWLSTLNSADVVEDLGTLPDASVTIARAVGEDGVAVGQSGSNAVRWPASSPRCRVLGGTVKPWPDGLRSVRPGLLRSACHAVCTSTT